MQRAKIRGGLVTILLLAMAIYASIVFLAYSFQERLLFHPRSVRVDPTTVSGLPIGMKEIQLKSEDGEELIAWYLPAKAGKPTILFFDGNGGHLPWSLLRWQKIAALDMGVFALAYRGYSGSSGRPSEAGLHRDAVAGYEWLARQVNSKDIIIHGSSLGSGVAIKLAVNRSVRALVLEAPYMSIADVASRRLWFLPVRLLLRNTFLSSDWIAGVKVPILIIHGDNDNTIPISQGKDIFELANQPKWFVEFTGAGHNDLPARGIYSEIDQRFGTHPKTKSKN
jgi:uncharacterized protein